MILLDLYIYFLISLITLLLININNSVNLKISEYNKNCTDIKYVNIIISMFSPIVCYILLLSFHKNVNIKLRLHFFNINTSLIYE